MKDKRIIIISVVVVLIAISMIIFFERATDKYLEDDIIGKVVYKCARENYPKLCVGVAIDLMEEVGYDEEDGPRRDLYDLFVSMRGEEN